MRRILPAAVAGIAVFSLTASFVSDAQNYPGGWPMNVPWTIDAFPQQPSQPQPVQPQQPVFNQQFGFPQHPAVRQPNGTYFAYAEQEMASLRTLPVPREQLSRDDLMAWDHIAMEIVKQKGSPPTIAARLYSNIAVAQREALLLMQTQGGTSKKAIDTVSANVVCRLMPDHCAAYQRFKSSDAYATALSSIIMPKIEARIANDEQVRFTQTASQTAGSWNGQGAVTPEAGQWQTWADQSQVQPAPPPSYGSQEDLAQVQAVSGSVGSLTAFQMGSLLHWAGSKGTETPGGIWLKYIDEALVDEQADIRRTADARSAMMMAVHDGFVLCWKTKFTYWTARPTMRDATLKAVIPVPNFPSYPSGHATISGAAAKVAGRYFPARAHSYTKMAQEAADGRVWAGIHFPVDSSAGLDLGAKAADNVLRRF